MHSLDRFHEAVPVHSVALDFGIRLRDSKIAHLNVCEIGVIFNKLLGIIHKNSEFTNVNLLMVLKFDRFFLLKLIVMTNYELVYITS